jgi:hypothetical protein
VLTSYTSPKRRNNVKTKKQPKTKQGSDSSADLPNQSQPQMEVEEPKSSAASPAEESLGARNPTTGLQTKRFSGAQRKIFTREREMNEGTWQDKIPQESPLHLKFKTWPKAMGE